MVAAGPPGPQRPKPAAVRDPVRDRARGTVGDLGSTRAPGAIAARFLSLVPALLLAMLLLRVVELGTGLVANSSASDVARVAGAALFADASAVLRHLPLLFVYSLPMLCLRSRRRLFAGLFVAWSALLLLQAALAQYFLTAREPLGADLFAYSWRDIRQTAAAGAHFNAPVWIAALLSISVLYAMLRWLTARERVVPSRLLTALAFAASLTLLLFTPSQPSHALLASDDAYNLALNKSAFFFDDSVGYLLRTQSGRARWLWVAGKRLGALRGSLTVRRLYL